MYFPDEPLAQCSIEQLRTMRLLQVPLNWEALRDVNGTPNGVFFSRHYNHVLKNIFLLANEAFEGTKVFTRDLWLYDYSWEFYTYAEVVGHSDSLAGNWKSLLLDNKERGIFIGAIIHKAIQQHVLTKNKFCGDLDIHIQKLMGLEDPLMAQTRESPKSNTVFLLQIPDC
jgi:hypothetical protein